MPRFQFGLRQLLISTAWLSAALGMVSCLAATWVDVPPPFIILVPAAVAGSVGALFDRAADWAMIGLVVALVLPVWFAVLAAIG